MKKRVWMIGGATLVCLLAVAWFWPLPTAITGEGMPESTRILDRNGSLLYEVQGIGFRIHQPLQAVPQTIIDALIATEDRTFRAHPGLSLRGIARAALRDLQAGRVVQGGSTITQQLVRTLLQPKSRGFLWKLREAWLALKLEARYTKDEILERYLNASYFGQGAYGIRSAANIYFNADISELSIGESALLVGLLNAPTSLNPFKDPAGAKERRDLVLRAMLENEALTQEDYDTATQEPVRLSHGKQQIRAPHFVLRLLAEHPELREHPEVTTTIDLDLQTESEQIVRRQVEKLADKNVTSAAVVVLDPLNGDILAMVGSADYFDVEHEGAVNVAVSPRQPGSALKPFTYALALANGMTAATTVADIEAQFFTQEGNPYIPRNYDFDYHGLVRYREALGNSYNIAAVKVLERVGVQRLLSFLQSLGLTTLTRSPEHYGLALTLGDGEVTLLELTAAYAMFARGGMTLDGMRVLDSRVAWLITDILSDPAARAAEFGLEGPLTFSYPVAAKTGTTRNSRDNWTVGYTPDRVVGVWVGNADNTPMRDTSGITGAGPIFHDVMERAMASIDKKAFARPEGIVDREICKLSGKLPTPLCRERMTEHFILGTEPTQQDDMFVELAIDTRTNLKATDGCPKQYVVTERFTAFPLELQKWAREKNWKLPPDAFSPLCGGTSGASASGSLAITRPGPEASFLLDPLVPDDQELIVFEARADDAIRTVDWYVNGEKVGQGIRPDFRIKWKPVVGVVSVEARSAGLIDRVRIEIRK